MLPSIVANKSVSVYSAQPVKLPGYRLLFNLRTSSLLEPSYANIEKDEASTIHGVLYCMSGKDMIQMDSMEGGGRSYVRTEVLSVTYDGHWMRCYAYICSPNNIAQLKLENFPPSKRYLDVLIAGAKYYKLDSNYILYLENHPFTPYPEINLTETQRDDIELNEYSVEDLKQWKWPEEDNNPSRRCIISIKGILFDFTDSDYLPLHIRKKWSGCDLTLFAAGRVFSKQNGEKLPKTIEEMCEDQKKYINATIADYCGRGTG